MKDTISDANFLSPANGFVLRFLHRNYADTMHNRRLYILVMPLIYRLVVLLRMKLFLNNKSML